MDGSRGRELRIVREINHLSVSLMPTWARVGSPGKPFLSLDIIPHFHRAIAQSNSNPCLKRDGSLVFFHCLNFSLHHKLQFKTKIAVTFFGCRQAPLAFSTLCLNFTLILSAHICKSRSQLDAKVYR